MKAIFCGTPEISVPSLEALSEVAQIVGVVCQPDRPAGRGLEMRVPAVKARALEMGLQVYQPTKVRDGELTRWMSELHADVALVIAYGRILTGDTLRAPRLGALNLHASLLPAYRGAAPIQRSLMDGQSETGVCLMQMDEGMDTGAVLACHRLAIGPQENAGTLAQRLGQLAAHVTRVELPRYFAGELSPITQDSALATYAPPIGPADCTLDFTHSALHLHHQIQGLSPRPGAAAALHRAGKADRRLRILESRPSTLTVDLRPGEVGWFNTTLLVGTGEGLLELVVAQVEGKKAQAALDMRNGRVLQDGDELRS